MARRRRKAAKKAEADEDMSSTGDDIEGPFQEEDSEDMADATGQEEGNETDLTEDANKDDETEARQIDDGMVTDEQDKMKVIDSIDTSDQVADNEEQDQEKAYAMDATSSAEAGSSTEAGGEKTSTSQLEEQMQTDGSAKDLDNGVANGAKNTDFSDKQEEEKAAPLPKVEKEPSQPECHDDDTVDVPVDPEAEEDEEVIGSESTEFLKFWRAVLENPHDFTNWTYLLQLVEQENKPPLARRAYNGFFKRYPLCYGYWKKFSEMEKRNGNLVRAQRILERGVRAIPLSIDLWVHMVDFYQHYYKGPDAGKEKVRKVFERAIHASGSEFRSEKLWNKYIQWEQENKDWKAVMAIYDRVLRIPTQHYSIFFKDFKDFVASRSPKEILPYQDFETLLEEVRDEAEASSKADEAAKAPAPTIDDDAPPGVESDDRGKPPNEKELKAVNDKVVAKKKKIFDETEALVTKIWTFEEGIKRPYFHVKALERTQIKNWRDYLEAEISRGEDKTRVILLFERCLIACALYEDFWLKYARYLSKVDAGAAKNVFQRACEIHLPKKPNIHMHWATFEESAGNFETASSILEKLDNTLPNMAMVRLRRAAVERRAGNLQAAEDLLKSFVAGAAKGTEECFYVRKFVWFLVKASNKFEVARQVLKDAIERNQDQVQLYKDLLGLEFSHGDEEHLVEACDLAINSQVLSEEVKFKFSQRKLEYLEDYGMDAGRTQKAYDEHQKLFRSHKKRAQSQSEAATAQPSTKKAKTEPISPVSGNKIMSTSSTRYSAKATTNGTYSSYPISTAQATASHTVAAAPIQTTNMGAQQQTYQQTAAAGDQSLYYQNYWNYQQKPNEVQQYNYNQWQQYPQQQYYQQ